MKTKADPTLPETFTLDNILSTFATDENARTFLESWIWPRGPVCPRCKQTDPLRVYLMTGASTRAGLYNCKDCRRQFTVTVGTIFEDSHIPIRKWIIGLFLMASSKKGMSSLQFQRILGLGSYRTALFMTDRIRFAMQDGGPFERKIRGHVEVDECYYGPKAKKAGPGSKDKKVAVIGLVERETGTRRSYVLKRATADGMAKMIEENVQEGATVNTDQSSLYGRTPLWFTHKSVNHERRGKDGQREYYRIDKTGDVVTTNFVESSFSLLRRGVIGTFHSLTTKYLPLYVGEFDFRFNHRKTTDGERMVAMIAKTKGKRTTLKELKAA